MAGETPALAPTKGKPGPRRVEYHLLGATSYQLLTDVGEPEAVDLQEFLAGLVAEGHRHRAPGQPERVGDEFAQLVVGPAFLGRRVDLELLTQTPDRRVAWVNGNDFDRKFTARHRRHDAATG